MIALLAFIATTMMIDAIFWFVDAAINYDEDGIASIAKSLLATTLILSAIAIMICASDLNTQKCVCGTKIESDWQFCAKCGKEISE